jgi:predicted NAD-dependent protein-ADP-ribosyltransferase YbiA (DUF1768 family)
MPARLVFFYKSKNVPPGQGTGETDLGTDVPESKALQDTGHWRSVLSNFYETASPIEFRGQHYRTAEHIFQAMKIALADPEAAQTFAVESGSALSKGDGLAARKARKLRVLSPALLAQWDAIRPGVVRDMWLAKFSQDPKSALVLTLTGKAELWHAAPRMKAERWTDLEAMR